MYIYVCVYTRTYQKLTGFICFLLGILNLCVSSFALFSLLPLFLLLSVIVFVYVFNIMSFAYFLSFFVVLQHDFFPIHIKNWMDNLCLLLSAFWTQAVLLYGWEFLHLTCNYLCYIWNPNSLILLHFSLWSVTHIFVYLLPSSLYIPLPFS